MAENSDADKPQKLVLQGEALKINPGGIPNNKVWSKMWKQLQPGLTRNLLPHSVNVSPKPSARTTKLSTGPTPKRQAPKLSPEPRCNLQRFPEPAPEAAPEISPKLIWAETHKLTLLGTNYSLTIAATQAKPKCSHAQHIPTLLQPGNPWVPARSASEKS